MKAFIFSFVQAFIMKEFFKKNMNKYHIIGIIFGVFFSMVYWIKVGRFSDNFLKKSPVLMVVWGLLMGYILFDLFFNAKNRKDRNDI